MNTIINISVNKLFHHPDNPRKDLGDLTELSDSIRINGILQNLTVVSMDGMFDNYTVIIGHRRLEAAKLAGLVEVPCTVVELDDKQQVSMMLLENMQREDLTPYEQARGFQMCLDLGVTVDELSKTTGFSKKTVKHRLKMLELDQNKVKKVSVQSSIDDFIKLEEIIDLNERNRLLDYIGTNNFGIELEKAKLRQEKEKESVEDVNSSEDVIGKVEKEEPEIIKVSFELRKNFMSEVFKRKIASNEIAKAVGVINTMFIEGINGKNDFDLFNEIVNPNVLENDDLIGKMLKHRSNFIVVAAYDLLETKNDKIEVYNYLEEFGYVMSDEEKGYFKHENS